MDYISALEATKKWDISERWVQNLCEENHTPDVVRFSCIWLIHKVIEKNVNNRLKYHKSKKWGDYYFSEYFNN